MKYEVTVGALFIDGVKHRRGDIVELADASKYGVRVQAVAESPKPKTSRKPKSEKVSVNEDRRKGVSGG